MPVKKSAKKALKQNIKKALKNKKIKDNIKTLLKKSRQEISMDKLDKAGELVKKSLKSIDKAVQKGILKKNTAARKKSRLMKSFHKKRSGA